MPIEAAFPIHCGNGAFKDSEILIYSSQSRMINGFNREED